jgi:MFS family permease
MMQTSKKTALLVVFLTVFIDLLGFGMVIPLVTIYAKQMAADYGLDQVFWHPFPWAAAISVSSIAVAALMTSYSMMQFVCAPLWGRLSDRIGRRPVLLIGLAGSTTFYGLFGLATLWRSLLGMFVARIGAGIACATISTAQAYIADVTPREKRARGMALVGAAFGLGFTFGPLLAALALWVSKDPGTSPIPGFVASALSATALLLACFRLPESLSPQSAGRALHHVDFSSLRAALRVPSIPLLLVISFLGVFALANLESTLALTIDHLLEGATRLSAHYEPKVTPQLLLVFAAIGLIQSIVQGGIVRKLAKHLSEAVLAATGGSLAITGFILVALVCGSHRGGIWGLLGGVAVTVSGIGFLAPSMQSLISRRSDPSKQGGIMGLGDSISTLARICGMSCGIILFYKKADLPFWTAAVMMSGALCLVLAAVRRGKDFEGPRIESPIPDDETTANDEIQMTKLPA